MRSLQRVSEAERRFLLDGVSQGMRNDGRGCFDLRRATFELDRLPSAMSSCRLRAGETEILVGVRCDMVRPAPSRPDAGHFQINVECAASVSVALLDSHAAEDYSRQLAVLLETLCGNDNVVDRRALCVLPGVFAWEVQADVLVLTSGGNLLDSASLALCAALSDLVLPKVQAKEGLEEGEQIQLTVDDRPEVGTPFPLRRLPLCVTVAQVQDRFLLDVTSEEELCADALVCVVVDARPGEVVGLHSLSRGLLNAALLPTVLERCRQTAATLYQQLDQELKSKQVKA